jgi:O-acetyl-ADP-ribose deacetylase (regulator of RNase III)
MDIHAKQHSQSERKDHDEDLKARNVASLALVGAHRLASCYAGLSVVRASLTDLGADAVVNAANEGLQGGGGVDCLLHNLASGIEGDGSGAHDSASCPLCAECRAKCPADAQGVRLRTGAAVVTAAFNVSGARFIVHTVGPYLDDVGDLQPALLRECYLNSLAAARAAGAASIAFPSISTGYYGYPILEAGVVALRAVTEFFESPAGEGWRIPVYFSAFSQLDKDILDGLLPPHHTLASLDYCVDSLPPGATLGVLFLQGSLCPITRAHALSVTEGRRLLLGQPLQCSSLPVACPLLPAGAPRPALCHAVVAIIGLNDSHSVNRKLAEMGEEALDWSERRALCKLALPYPWVYHAGRDHSEFAFSLVRRMRERAEGGAAAITVVSYQISGTDDALRFSKWVAATPSQRLLIPLRSPNPLQEDTLRLLASMGGTGAWPEVLLGPGLPEISATLARRALREGDEATARAALHDDVVAWLRAKGPWPPRHPAPAFPPGPWECPSCTLVNDDGNEGGGGGGGSSGAPRHPLCGACGEKRPLH